MIFLFYGLKHLYIFRLPRIQWKTLEKLEIDFNTVNIQFIKRTLSMQCWAHGSELSITTMDKDEYNSLL